MKRTFLVAALAVQMTGARVAHGSAAELFGLSSEESAVAGASTARVGDFSAGYYNPAGLTRVDRATFSVGVLGFGSQLTIHGQVQPIADPVGVVIGATAPVPLGWVLRDRLFVGIALFVLPDGVARVISHPPEQPFFPYYDNRTQRLVVLPSLGIRLWRGLSVGLALNYLAGLGGRVEASEGTTRAIEPRVDEAIFATVRINAGAQWRSPSDRLAFGLTFRQGFSVPFTTVTQNRVAGQPIDLNVDAEGLFTPDELVAGAAVRATPWLRLSLDATWAMWSRWRGPYVAVSSALPIIGTIAAPPPTLVYRDTGSLRLGVEGTRSLGHRVQLALRGGYAFESSPIPAEQPGETNLLDGPKHLLATGAGIAITVGKATIRIDVEGQIQILQPVTLVKRIVAAGGDPAAGLHDEVQDDPRRPETLGVQISNPGYPSIRGAGFVWASGLTLSVSR